MDRSEAARRIKSYIEEEFPNPGGVELTEDTNLLEDWFIDSLSLVTTIIFLEKEFGVTVRRGDITAENFHNIATLSNYVARLLAQGGA